MQDSVRNYIETVKNQVRWKQSHKDIGSELQNHIEEQAESYLKEGFSQESAYQRAVREMGDPVEVGAEFDRVYKPIFRWDLVSFIILFTLGGIALHLAINLYLGMWINFTVAAVSIGLGAFLLIAGNKMDFTLFTKYPLYIYIGFILLIMLFLWLSPEYNGRRFFINGREFASLFFLYPVIFSGLVCKLRNQGLWGCLICAVTYLIVAILAVAGNRLFLFINISFVCAPVMYYAINKNWFGNKKLLKVLFIGTVTAFTTAIIFFFWNQQGRWYGAKVQAIIAPHKDPFGYGYQNMMIREFFQSSKFIGMSNIGKDINSWIPNIGTDNMFTFVAYRFGILAFLTLIGMIAFFLLKAVRLCLKQKSFYGKIFSLTIIGIYAIQFIIYIVNNTGSFIMFANPPFIKYTGVNYLVNMFLFGILLSVLSCEKLFLGEGSINEEASDGKFIEMKNKQVIIDFNYFKRRV